MKSTNPLAISERLASSAVAEPSSRNSPNGATVTAVLKARVTPITVTTWPDEATRTLNSGCLWIAEATIDDRTYEARSRHGAPNELARQLVAAGLADRPMVIHYRGCAWTMTYRSFHATATWTFGEGDQPLRRVKYREQPEGIFLGSGTRQKRVSSPAVDIVEPQLAEVRETHFCDGCGKAFQPPRPWSRFCSPACRLRAHRRLARQDENVALVVECPTREFG